MTKSQIPNPNVSTDGIGENPSDSVPSVVARWMLDHPKMVLAILAGLMAIQISANWKPDPDGVNYLSIARTLALHGRLARQGMPHLYYAPGYAILISPAFFLGAYPFAEIGVIQLVFAVVLMLATYRWFARYEPRGAIFVTAFVMVNVGFWDLFRQTRAEIAFMAALMGSAVLLASAAEASTRRRFILTTAAAVVLMMVMCCIRQVGFLLAGGFALTLLARAVKQQISWSRAIFGSGIVVAAAMAVVIGLILYDAHTARESGPDEVTYLQNRRDLNQSLSEQVIEGIRRQTAEVGRLVLPGMWKSYSSAGHWLNFNTVLYLLVSGAVGASWWRLMRETLDPLVAAFPLYFLLFVVWPFDQGTRFTVPMLPVLGAAVWYLLRPMGANRQIVFVVLIVAHVCVSLGVWARDANIVARWNREWPAMRKVAANIPVDAKLIVARELRPEQWMFLTYLTDRRFMWKSLDEPIPARADYVISAEAIADAPGFAEMAEVDGLKIERRIAQGYFVFNWRRPSDNIARYSMSRHQQAPPTAVQR
jgi:hypothetical protein